MNVRKPGEEESVTIKLRRSARKRKSAEIEVYKNHIYTYFAFLKDPNIKQSYAISEVLNVLLVDIIVNALGVGDMTKIVGMIHFVSW